MKERCTCIKNLCRQRFQYTLQPEMNDLFGSEGMDNNIVLHALYKLNLL